MRSKHKSGFEDHIDSFSSSICKLTVHTMFRIYSNISESLKLWLCFHLYLTASLYTPLEIKHWADVGKLQTLSVKISMIIVKYRLFKIQILCIIISLWWSIKLIELIYGYSMLSGKPISERKQDHKFSHLCGLWPTMYMCIYFKRCNCN